MHLTLGSYPDNGNPIIIVVLTSYTGYYVTFDEKLGVDFVLMFIARDVAFNISKWHCIH